jgi:hypothetical protein
MEIQVRQQTMLQLRRFPVVRESLFDVALTKEQECLDTLDRRKPFTVPLKMVHLSISLCTPTKQIKVLSGEPVLSHPLFSFVDYWSNPRFHLHTPLSATLL